MSKGIGANCGTISAITEGLFGAIQKDILKAVLENKPKTDLMAKGVGLSNFRLQLMESYNDPSAVAGPTKQGAEKWKNDQKEHWGSYGDPKNIPIIGGMFRGSGYHNTQIVEPSVSYNQAMNEKVVAQGNTRMVFGRDRMQGDCGLSRGYGGLGVRGAASIDMVAGPVSCFEKEEDSGAGASPAEPIKANPSPHFDASRLLLSQKCDADDAFNLANGSIGNVRGKAAAVLKSDCVRIIGRHSIKIVAGGVGSHTSDCKEIIETLGIDLIAQNEKGIKDYSGKGTPPANLRKVMQPLVLGDNLVEYLKAARAVQTKLCDTLTGLCSDLQVYSQAIATHVHGFKPGGVRPEITGPLLGAGETIAANMGITSTALGTAGAQIAIAGTGLAGIPGAQGAAAALGTAGTSVNAASAALSTLQVQMTTFNTTLNGILMELASPPAATSPEGLAAQPAVPAGGLAASSGVFSGAKAMQNIDNLNSVLKGISEELGYLSKINTAKYICSKYNRTN